MSELIVDVKSYGSYLFVKQNDELIKVGYCPHKDWQTRWPTAEEWLKEAFDLQKETCNSLSEELHYLEQDLKEAIKLRELICNTLIELHE